MSIKRRIFHPGRSGPFRDLGLLVARLGFGGSIALGHGWGKLIGFGAASGQFPDPLGIGSSASLALAIFAEFFCGMALLVGFFGRISAVPLVITMAVAFFIHHGGDPFPRKEKALLYLVGFLALAATGPGRFSIDSLIAGD